MAATQVVKAVKHSSHTSLERKLERVQELLQETFASAPGEDDVCLTCSFQAGGVLVLKLAMELRPTLPVLFLDTGYHFAETYAYRDRIEREWGVRLINVLPLTTIAEQEAKHGRLYESNPDRCCAARKVEPLFRAVASYRVWITGLRREQAKTRAALEESSLFTLPGGRQIRKLSPLAHFSTAEVWRACEELDIPLLPLYARGYTSIGCAPCTLLPLDPSDARSGRWSGRKVECGIHIQAAK